MSEESNNQNDEVKIVTPPNDIKKKVGEGGIPPENIQKAEETMTESASEFEDVAREDLDIILDAITQGRAGEKLPAQIIREINASCFELKSNAGMFNYPLVTDIATSLFQLTDMLEDVNDEVLDVLHLHYQAMRAAINIGGTAASPEEAKALIKGLMGASSKVLQDLSDD